MPKTGFRRVLARSQYELYDVVLQSVPYTLDLLYTCLCWRLRHLQLPRHAEIRKTIGSGSRIVDDSFHRQYLYQWMYAEKLVTSMTRVKAVREAVSLFSHQKKELHLKRKRAISFDRQRPRWTAGVLLTWPAACSFACQSGRNTGLPCRQVRRSFFSLWWLERL
ncbi:hypothetical protein N7510_005180 [Penicillium lagena]|uniref:uncharacterized protein n=1 Tax=Penicillium lagena TaxID=94218 RepID=UPI00254194F9|nr:uncharacterized protein N7510_005180 [Penicillium lagena]KAJ5611986.1 hypothetical protein N7510_005180 [Penicillium lagena]